MMEWSHDDQYLDYGVMVFCATDKNSFTFIERVHSSMLFYIPVKAYFIFIEPVNSGMVTEIGAHGEATDCRQANKIFIPTII